MMTNLFSVFDPSSIFLTSFNWISMILGLMILPLGYWMSNSRLSQFWKLLKLMIHNELKVLMGESYIMGTSLFYICLMMMILFSNFFGLFPYVFTGTSHMVISMGISFPMWMGFMWYGWFTNTNKMFLHLLPMGTPVVLMSFMIMIEMVSNLIRPLTLAIRLSANMIAGHLLLTLLGNQGVMDYGLQFGMVIISQVLLLMLELAVAIIQSYVFMVLLSLYSSEIH